ncbi:MAG TPA: carbohydrate binding domain-containing protein [Acidimicrobiia bacterium]|nr:carbohydrate binding domain-containing protein [Acidimicrobiia bacterium]
MALLAGMLPAQATSFPHNAVVSDNPADTTPHLIYDAPSQSIFAFAQVGNTMYAGGEFNQIQDPTRTTTFARQNFVAFDAKTGNVLPLELSFDGMVTSIVAHPDGSALFISGTFARVNGIVRRGIAKYDLVNERIDPVFAPKGMRTVSDLAFANGTVIAAGNFSKHVMALDPVTGADAGTINITVAGVVDTTDETRVKEIAVSPDGTRLVATGNFTSVNGQNRRRAFMLNLSSGGATLSTWYNTRFDVNCVATKWRISARGVDFSPDGSYFVIVSTGGPTGTNGLCDAAARFDTANVSSNAQPKWINWTGGDTLWSVAITGAAVYVGGHQRWLDNPQGSDSPGPGAVSRPGIGAIDPETGKALAWNPTHSRNNGVTALYVTPDGLWAGSDGTRFGSEDHAGIGFAPLDPSNDSIRPVTMIDSGPGSSVSDTTAVFTFSANEPSTFQCRLDGGTFEPCTSPFTYDNLSAGPHTFQVFAVDASYNMDATPAEQTWEIVTEGTELIGNPGFESGLDGWRGDGSSNLLARVPGGNSSSWAVEISKSSGGGTCGIDDSPNWVATTEAGTYTAGIWARTDTSGITLTLRVREYVGGSRQQTASATLPLTTVWQRVTTEITPVSPGSTLDFEAYTTDAGTGVCFQADDASITKNVGPPPDTTPPETTIDSGPSGSVPDTSATFTFSANEPATFQCRLDGVDLGACSSPVSFDNLNVGSHNFQVVATDASPNQNVDPTPAVRDWTVFDPDGELIGNPGFEANLSGWRGDSSSNTLTRVEGGHSGGWAVEIANTTGGGTCGVDDSPNWLASTEEGTYTAGIWARSDNSGVTLTLRVREYLGGSRQQTVSKTLSLTTAWQRVTSEITTVAPGSTLDFEAYATGLGTGVCFQADDASLSKNAGPAPGDATPPDTFIDSGPSGSVAETSATFTFSASEPSTFQCRLDGAALTSCTSPVDYLGLSAGPHTFEVVATDVSANVDPTPAMRTWIIGEPPPDPEPGELIGNPGFETDTSGWRGQAASNTLALVAGGHSGNWAVEVSKSDAGSSCGIDDSPNWVAVTAAGTYTASIWVRSDTPGITLRLRVREFLAGTRLGTVTETLALTGTWQQVAVAYTVTSPGSTLDFEAYTTNAPAGVCFQADDASIKTG